MFRFLYIMQHSEEGVWLVWNLFSDMTSQHPKHSHSYNDHEEAEAEAAETLTVNMMSFKKWWHLKTVCKCSEDNLLLFSWHFFKKAYSFNSILFRHAFCTVLNIKKEGRMVYMMRNCMNHYEIWLSVTYKCFLCAWSAVCSTC